MKGYLPSIETHQFKGQWKHGATRTVRVPVALADQVLDYARKLDNGETQETKPRDTSDSSDYNEAVEILQKALTLKPNAGGAIKAEIRKALILLQSPL